MREKKGARIGGGEEMREEKGARIGGEREREEGGEGS